MRCWKTIFVLAMIGATVAAFAGQQPSSHPKAPGNKSRDKVVEITLPEIHITPPNGPNLEVYEKNCLLCHSAQYVLMQPSFPRSTWEKEVTKMVDAYGANIPESDRPKIVEYLVAIKGAPPSK
jgi:cytochrome c5